MSDSAIEFFSRYYKYPFGEHYPRQYVALYLEEDFEIDGNLDKAVWESVPWSDLFMDIQGHEDDPAKNPPADCPTRMKMRYSDSFLYVAARVTSTNREMVAKLTERNSVIFNDSDFEVFLDIWSCTHQYKEFEGNAINTVWNLLLDKPYIDGGREWSGRCHNREHGDHWDMDNLRTATRMLRGQVNEVPASEDSVVECAYEIAFSIEDLKSLKKMESTKASTSKIENNEFAKKAGEISGGGSNQLWRINFSRVEDEGPARTHLVTQNWVWSPQIVWDAAKRTFEGKIDMHLPDAWGYVQLAGNELKPVCYDVFFPARLVAMNVYYAKKRGTRASSLEQLQEFLHPDPDFWNAFDVELIVPYSEEANGFREAAEYSYAVEVFPKDQSSLGEFQSKSSVEKKRLGVRVLSDRFTQIIEGEAR